MPDKAVPDFFLYLQDRDLGKWKLPYSREISAAVRSYPQDFEEWRKMSGIGGETWEQLQAKAELAEQGVAILRAVGQMVEMLAGRALRAWFDTEARRVWWDRKDAGSRSYEVVAVNAPLLQSEVCERLLAMHPEVGIAAAYYRTVSGTWEWSLRSRPGVDCSVVAKAMGGGGHERAAGCRVEEK